MVKRLASAMLWFIAVGWGLNFLTTFLGLPSVLGLAVAAGVATFVGVDPMHLFWPDRVRVAQPSPVRTSTKPRPIRTNA